MADRNPLAAVAHGHTLAEAIVDTVREPLVVLDRDLRVIAAKVDPFTGLSQWSGGTLRAGSCTCWVMGSGTFRLCGLSSKTWFFPKHRTVEAYEVEHEFPTIGRRVMLLNARQVFRRRRRRFGPATGDRRRNRASRYGTGKRRAAPTERSPAAGDAASRRRRPFRLSQASFCSRRGPFLPRRFVCTCTTPTSASCRWQRCNSICRRRD